MDYFFSCDWGTSSFRLRLIRASDLVVIAETKSSRGISDTYKLWQQTSTLSLRSDFYANIVKDEIKFLQQDLSMPTDGIPVLFSGMASSTIGMVDLPYKRLPFNLDGSDLKIEFITNSAAANPFVVISGACTDCDVMRGEETKIVGCQSLLDNSDQEQLLILPGTHPKHIVVKNNQAIDFKTYMTGEFFNLLSVDSILSASVAEGGDLDDPQNQDSFIEGVRASRHSNLLHASFMVRTNQVLKNIPPTQNFHYLSGLLIGTELGGLKPDVPIYLVGGAVHASLYKLACNELNLRVNMEIDADLALIKGQQAIFSRLTGQY
ncbi:2-keto-3-deoxy-galactonokinase [Pedobacter ginsengisoli]|uniref:2-keto-3-deoxy-galactonokinase n=1 Tax=Pedobacter ginsengisoli TaxID=363852 RepID=A0A2D1U187_9SPHI|nr:2-dehydro-3-deoxygalactonokinase [Pedobacter ginsengisoli]ATP55264.1 2-keto-3-deoxy-galactonokinase [Pedobacter ginsengisoli]